jgi:hypothetical protein
VYRLQAREPGHGVVAPYTGGETLFSPDLTGYSVGRRYAGGATISARPAAGGFPAGSDLLLVVRADGTLAPVTQSRVPAPEAQDTMVLLGPALAEADDDPARTGRADA